MWRPKICIINSKEFRGSLEVMMVRRKYNPYLLPSWLRTIREVARQLIIPFTIFQAIRTLLLPTTFDVILLMVFVIVAVGFHIEFI